MVASEMAGTQQQMDLERFMGRSLLRMIETSRGDPGMADDFDRSAQVLVDEGAEMLPGIECRITVVSPGSPPTVCFNAVAGRDAGRLRGTEWPAEQTPTGWTIGSLAPVERTVRQGQDGIAPELIPGSVATIRAVPLPGAEQPVEGQPNLGAFVVQRRGDEPFTGEERRAIDAYSSLIGVALLRTRSYNQARSSALEMSSFIDLIVHELRSPLTVIAGYVDLIRGHGAVSDPVTEKAIGIVSSKVAEMQRLVDELVLSARLGTGSAPPDPAHVDLAEAVVRAVERAEPRGRMVEARLSAQVPGHPVRVACDPAHVAHILDNLINNALNYGGDRPWVEVSVNGDGPRVMVADSGPGISRELHDRVFDRFFRVNPMVGHAGSGLGLFISRKLAEQAGGSLEIAYSEPGKGSRFCLTLPAAA